MWKRASASSSESFAGTDVQLTRGRDFVRGFFEDLGSFLAEADLEDLGFGSFGAGWGGGFRMVPALLEEGKGRVSTGRDKERKRRYPIGWRPLDLRQRGQLHMSQHLGHLGEEVRKAASKRMGDIILVDVACRVNVVLLGQSDTDRGNEVGKLEVVAVLEAELAELCDAATKATREIPWRFCVLNGLEKSALDGIWEDKEQQPGGGETYR